MEQRKQKGAWSVLLAAAVIIISCVTGAFWGQMEDEQVYTLYIGLNDRDTYEQEIPTEVAEKIVDEICLRYVDGYTLSEAKGAWKDETGTITEENTFVCSFEGVKREEIEEIMDDILPALNQNAILVESRSAGYEYYHGNHGGEAYHEAGGK